MSPTSSIALLAGRYARSAALRTISTSPPQVTFDGASNSTTCARGTPPPLISWPDREGEESLRDVPRRLWRLSHAAPGRLRRWDPSRRRRTERHLRDQDRQSVLPRAAVGRARDPHG